MNRRGFFGRLAVALGAVKLAPAIEHSDRGARVLRLPTSWTGVDPKTYIFNENAIYAISASGKIYMMKRPTAD